jgi:hypothetical protein
MTTTTITVLGTTVNGTPSGNYDGSSLDFVSDAAKAVGYYRGQGSLQTLIIQVTGFAGTIIIQGSLDETPTGIDSQIGWSDVYEYGDISSSITDYHPQNITGNFAWIRAVISNFEAGTINSITTTY